MPGSPPTSTTEPATSPPPSTRSSSARPVERRSAAPAVTVASGRGFSPPGAPARAARARGSGSASSTIVLHAPQPGHCPSQRGAAWPHCWQTKAERRALSTMRALQVDKGGRTRHDRRVRVLDAELAALEDTEAALLFPSGYQANVGAITALVGRGDHVYSDALNHASIVDGCRLSRASVQVYPHRDVQALEAALAATPRGGRRLIVSDSVFSMDGDRAPLQALAALAEEYHSWLMVDEAHATAMRREGLRALGLDARGDTHIVPVLVGDNRAALALADELLARGVHALAIRPPTVPQGTARLRVTPMATHTTVQLERALAAFGDAARTTGLVG